MAPIRNAEKKRNSTCPFADTIATASIKLFRSHAESRRLEGQQTVLAAIAMMHEGRDLRVRLHLQFSIYTRALY